MYTKVVMMEKTISAYTDRKNDGFELTITSQEWDPNGLRLFHENISSVFSEVKSTHELLQNIATPLNKLNVHLCYK